MYLTVLIAMGMVMGCSEKEILSDVSGDGGSVVNPADGVYISVSVQLPDGGPSKRSNTVEPGDASNDSTESGKDYENKVSKMLIVLARNSGNGFIAAGTVDSAKDSVSLETVGSTVHATAKISKTVLANYYGSDGRLDPSALNEDKVNVFVVCNYTDELINYFKFNENGISGLGKFSTEWIDQICSVAEDNSGNPYDNVSIWKKNNMLMTNASVASKKLPLNLSEWDDFSSSAKPFNLSGANVTSNGETIQNDGSIRVERSVARFDFKDGSALTGNRYHAVYVKNEEGSTTNYVDIVLNRMALVNMSNKFYYFRRVTDAENPPKVGYPELPWAGGLTGNYVVDVDYDKKELGTTHFNFPLFNTSNNKTIDETARGQWYTSKIKDVLGEDKESDRTESYKIWRYVTENTVDGINRMVNGLSTGIVFKGKMEPTDYLKNPTGKDEANTKALKKLAYVLGFGKGDWSQESLGLSADDIKDIIVNEKANTNTDPILYTYGGMLYLRWPSIREAAIADAKIEGTEEYDYTRSFYQAVFGNGHHDNPQEGSEGGYSSDKTSPDYLWHEWQKSKLDDSKLLNFKNAATSKGITLYQSSDDDADGPGYYCYYFYWNQHNNNDNPGVMGEMEFAVVRNNVYKLAVTKIDRLGHPRLSENDPDPSDPDDPDEKGDVYITVSVEPLPWVVRENNIEF